MKWNKETSKKRYDLWLVGAFVIVGLILTAVLYLGRQDGAKVVVTVSGKTVKTLPLSEDATYEISGANGGTNLLVIEGGQAAVMQASCPDLLCVHMSSIRYNGQSIVCLPNEVVVSIEGGEENEIDTVAQ